MKKARILFAILVMGIVTIGCNREVEELPKIEYFNGFSNPVNAGIKPIGEDPTGNIYLLYQMYTHSMVIKYQKEKAPIMIPVFQFKGNNFHGDTKTGWPTNIAMDESGNIYFATMGRELGVGKENDCLFYLPMGSNKVVPHPSFLGKGNRRYFERFYKTGGNLYIVVWEQYKETTDLYRLDGIKAEKIYEGHKRLHNCYKTSDGFIWMKSGISLIRFNPKTNEEDSVQVETVPWNYSLAETNNGKLYVGCGQHMEKGLFLVDRKTLAVEEIEFFHNLRVKFIEIDQQGDILIRTLNSKREEEYWVKDSSSNKWLKMRFYGSPNCFPILFNSETIALYEEGTQIDFVY